MALDHNSRIARSARTLLLVAVALSLVFWAGGLARAEAPKAVVSAVQVSLPTLGAWSLTQSAVGQRLQVEGFDLWMQPAEPMLPYRTLRVLLPADADLSSVKVEWAADRWVDMPGTFDLAPAPPLASEDADGAALVAWGDLSPEQVANGRSVRVYEQDGYWPEQPVRLASVGAYRQWLYAELAYFPVQYNAMQGALRKCEGGQATVHFARQSLTLAPSVAAVEERFWSHLASEVVNPGDRDAFYPQAGVQPNDLAAGAYNNYVIITTEAIRSGSSQLAAFALAKERQGFAVKIVTEGAVADDTHYLSGASADARADNIRNWLASRYLAEGIEYVLLVGNPHPTTFSAAYSVPMKMTYPRSASSSYRESPTDMYYSDLSSNWNPDGDSLFGEFSEVGIAGGIDRTPEVYVGRIPFYGSLADLDAVLAKTVAYGATTGPIGWRNSLLVAAAISNHGPQDNNGDGIVQLPTDYPIYYRTFGADWGEHLKTLAVNNGYTAYTLYEKTGVYSDGSAYPITASNAALTTSNLVTEWANGYGFAVWWGHGNSTGAYRRLWTHDSAAPNPGDRITQLGSETTDTAFITTNDLAALSNSKPAFVVQVSCTNGYPEASNNLGYALLRQGAIGTFSASRVSWYFMGAWEPMNYADNAAFAYYIFQRMSSLGESAGQALAMVRSTLNLANAPEMWMNVTDHNLYGDPSLSLSSRMESTACPPLEPTIPSPPDAAEHVSTHLQLAWCGGLACEGAPVRYDVYLDADNDAPETLVCSGLLETTCDPGPLAEGTTYYWQVIARNADGDTPGPVWQFTTLTPTAGVSVSAVPTQTVGWGEQARFDHQVQNTGNIADTYDLSHSAPPGWLVQHPASLQISAGASQPLSVLVTPPFETPSGFEAQIAITVTSRLQPEVYATAVDRVQVTLPPTVSVLFPDQAAFLEDGQGVEIVAPAGVVSQPLTLVLVRLAQAPHALPTDLGFGGVAFRLEAYRGGQRVDVVFDAALEVTLFYDIGALGSVQDADLDLYLWDGEAWALAACEATERHPDEDWLTVPVCQTGEFVLAGPKPVTVQHFYHIPVVRGGY